MANTINCPVCNELHEIDKYGWVQTCIGYFDILNFDYEITKWMENNG